MFRSVLLTAALMGASSVAVLPTASAQAPVTRAMSSAEMSSRIVALESSTADAERLRQENARLRLDMRDMQGQLSASNGKVERLEFQLAQANEEISALQADNQAIASQLTSITDRLNTIESEAAYANTFKDPALATPGIDPETGQMTLPADHPAVTGVARPSGGPVDLTPTPSSAEMAHSAGAASAEPAALSLPTDPQALFDFGKGRLVQFDYAGAEAAFSAFLEAHDGHERASEAQYWLGEVQYQLEDYPASGATYTAMIRQYPDDPRAADALVKLARSMRLVGETEKACAALGAIDRRYPNASAVTRNLANLERSKAQCSA